MRCFLVASIVAGLAGNAYSHYVSNTAPPSIKLRKSLGFGPHHPHAAYDTSVAFQPVSFTPKPALEVAQDFVSELMTKSQNLNIDGAVSWKLRKDSYTDKNTGVTHVYVKQLVNGLEVADGDMNINVKDGKVISYGNSFYNGVAPQPLASSNLADTELPHDAYCEYLGNHQQATSYSTSQGAQVVMGEHKRIDLEHLINSHCKTPAATAPASQEAGDFRPALMKFMLSATPSAVVADVIQNEYTSLVDQLEVTPVHHFADGEAGPQFTVANVPDTVNPVKAKLAYIQVPSKDGKSTVLELVWKFEVEMEDNWYEASVSASSPHDIISVVDWASDASLPAYAPIPTDPDAEPATYKVFKWGVNDPTEAERTLEKENFDPDASPVGWHSLPVANDPFSKGHRRNIFNSEGWIERGIELGKKWLKKGKDKHGNDKVEEWRNTTVTWGNNVFAQENWEGQNSYIDNFRPNAGSSKAFDYAYAPKKGDGIDNLTEAKKYINNTVAQLFYTTNMVHDLYYRYGFDEVSGNFQQHNFGRGGEENDAVIANAQDGSGYNNANFMTPPDGQNGRMRMYLWNTATPYRDGDLEAGIVIHELTHGLSTRLTGGPANSGCLGWGESGGMGEGWGDFLATIIRSGKEIESAGDYSMGAWAANRDQGIRNYVYSINETINPSTYKTLDKPGYWGVHAIGEVWAEILYVVTAELVKKHGAAADLFPPKDGEDESSFYKPGPGGAKVPIHGNTLIVQLVLNGMKLQPCRPSFFDARDAIIQADNILTGGANACELWRGFAKRGLGKDAKVEGRTPWGGGVRSDGHKVPDVCA